MPASHHSVFTGRIPFLPPNQQRQSTEGKKHWSSHGEKKMGAHRLRNLKALEFKKWGLEPNSLIEVYAHEY